MKTRVYVLIAILAGLFLVGLFISCSKTLPNQPSGTEAPALGVDISISGRAGTTLNTDVTAECMREFDWAVEKSMDPVEFLVPQGECIESRVTVRVTREYNERMVGEIYVLNGGERATENLNIEVTVLCRTIGIGGPYADCFGPFVVDVSGNPVLDPGESDYYSYSVPMTFDEGNTYKVNADITITNHSGRLGVPFGPSPDSESFPACDITDKTAVVTDVDGVPDGFGFAVSPASLTFIDAGVGEFVVSICNETAECGKSFSAVNTVVLEEGDSYTPREGSAVYSIYTGDCSGGCTYTQGYWKNHPIIWPVARLTLGTVEYNQTELLEIFRTPVRGNGLVLLAHQLIAAKLNIANGADGSDISTTIVHADDVIGDLVVPPIGDGYLPPVLTERMATTIDNYNNGIIGPGHCGD